MEELKKYMSADGVPDELIRKAMDLLQRVYIAQHIRENGVLQHTFSRSTDATSVLKKYGLIKEDRWYSHELYLTTEKGRSLASLLVKMLTERYTSIIDIINNCSLDIPPLALEFLIFDHFQNELSFPVGLVKEYTFDWREPILDDARIQKLRDEILYALEKAGLCIKTDMYVSTRGGELRGPRYVVSPEVQSFLVGNERTNHGIGEEMQRSSRTYLFFNEMSSVLQSNEGIEMIREVFWERLRHYDLSERDIRPIVDSMSRESITSVYSGIAGKEKPFEIRNPASYSNYLKDHLIEPLLDSLLEPGRTKVSSLAKLPEKKPSSIDELRKEKEKIIGRIPFEELGELFVELVIFEMKLRSLIREHLQREFGDSWWKRINKDIRDKCEKRRRKDIEEGREPENDPLDYADFAHYVLIFEQYWRLFNEYFRGDRSRLKTYLDDINSLGRNKVMHIRTLTPDDASLVRQEMKWLSDSMDTKSNRKPV